MWSAFYQQQHQRSVGVGQIEAVDEEEREQAARCSFTLCGQQRGTHLTSFMKHTVRPFKVLNTRKLKHFPFRLMWRSYNALSLTEVVNRDLPVQWSLPF